MSQFHQAATRTIAQDFPPQNGCGAHRVFLRVPAGGPPPLGWPLLITTDGNASYDLAVAAMRVQAADRLGSGVTEGVVMAIGYPGDDLYHQAGRCWDLTPPPGQEYPSKTGDPVRTGGAPSFLAWIETVLLPWLDERVALDPDQRTLFGHSFGGLFALFALFNRPLLFQTIVAASPSLYWEQAAIRPFEDAFFARTDLAGAATTVHLSAGEWEGDVLAPHLRDHPDADRLLADRAAIAKIVRVTALKARFDALGASRLECMLEVFAGQTHMSVLPVAVGRAVQAAFGPLRR